MKLNELTIEEAKQKLKEYEELKKIFNLQETIIPENSDVNKHWEIGQNYFYRSVTHSFTGKLVDINELELVFDNVSWISDLGRESDSFKDGIEKSEQSEIEPYPADTKVIVGRGALINACIYNHRINFQPK
ncbi:MAG: hypothetical protein V3V84_00770 [Candidatus Bathyarchaeia archaeon]